MRYFRVIYTHRGRRVKTRLFDRSRLPEMARTYGTRPDARLAQVTAVSFGYNGVPILDKSRQTILGSVDNWRELVEPRHRDPGQHRRF